MKIACDSCGAKYTIADEKVAGKTVKIRCKKCGATMVIDGHAAAGSAVKSSMPPGAATEAAPGWMLHTGEGDQETATVAQIVERYRDGRIDGSTYVWRDGMADWKALRDVAELFAVCVSAVSHAGAVSPAAVSAGAPVPRASRPVESARRASSPPTSMPIDSILPGHDDATSAVGVAMPAASPPRDEPAARGVAARAKGPSAKGALTDVLAASATASTAPQPMGAPTGQRNDNSVLFSLASLSGPGAGAEPPSGSGSDQSGLIDMRALAQLAPKPDAKKGQKLDDIMNLSSGGLFGGGAVSPVMTQTYQAVQMQGAAGPQSGVSRSVLAMAMVGGIALVAAAAGGVFLALKKSPASDTPSSMAVGASDQAAAGAALPALEQAMPVPLNAPSAGPVGPAGAASSAPSGTDPSTALAAEKAAAGFKAKGHTFPNAPPAAATAAIGAVKPAGPGKHGASSAAVAAAHFGPGGAASKPVPAAPSPPAAPSRPVTASSLESAMGAATRPSGPAAQAPRAAAAPSASGAAFDRGAAAAELRRVTDGVASCRKSNGPTGDGHVTVTFRTDGTVDHVEVDRPPYQGSPVGACVASKYKLARVPAFGGTPITVGKSFSID